MFGFFKKKPAQKSPPPLSKSPEKMALINQRLAELGDRDIHPMESAIVVQRLIGPAHMFEFMHSLATSSVELVLSENNPESPPLILTSPENFLTLAVFTQQKRAAKFQEQHPERRFHLPLSFPDVLRLLKKSIGIAINLYDEKTEFKMSPDMVDSIRSIILDDNAVPSSPPVQQSSIASVGALASLAAPPPLSKYRPGQVWAFHSSTVAPGATLTILRVEEHEKLGNIVHISVSGVRLPKGGTSIGHMPFAEASIDRSVTRMIQDGDGIVKPNEGYDQWREQRGGVFTISVADGINSVKQAVSARGDDLP